MKDTNQKRTEVRTAIASLIVFVIVMSLYAYARLSDPERVWKPLIVILTICGIAKILIDYKGSARLDTAFYVAFFVVFLSIILNPHGRSLGAHRALLFATILYRPEYMVHGDRRLAFALSLMIMGAVLPVTLGLVTDWDAIQALSFLYALLVASLWVFCSKLGARFFGSSQSPTET
jgi:FtsH-binding integral membrane protein